ncbi:hypothetical protein R1sor_014264 [Riccia sorocarpa]|uniref:Uncharacterized protein n=1 Tax=Riccia sorocarpa TaxID=122646 RepID=A0ABD3HC34_9MARC
MDLFATGFRRLFDFPVKGKCCQIVPSSDIEDYFLKRIVRTFKKDMLVINQMQNLIGKSNLTFCSSRPWDSEKGELVHQRDALKDELTKAKKMDAEAEKREEVVCLEKETM